MLEVKNLVKKYEMKGGATVKALNNVSIKFPNKGMVFILGKSGSGKSTLLNVMGGLDKPDSGEIIIQNKSSRDFEQKDFDSYRNTYIGFIFQEYNLLDDFNVEENIALALELQKKSVSSQQLSSILSQVGLSGLGKRKVKALSGGQKQRVAIARALIKDPEIIFGDEPSGALDSNTGKQIFDTLKELSKEKLIVIISHDRDFAEMYADRIIELKDGEIIADITKIQGLDTATGLIELGNGIVKVPKGKRITNVELSKLNNFLEKSPCESYITINPIINDTISAVIGDSTNEIQFVKTTEANLNLGRDRGGVFKQIKSHLSWRKCIKMCFAILKHKPIRLIITTLLCVISFTLFALTTTFSTYSKTDSASRTIYNQKLDYIPITKVFNSSTDPRVTNFTSIPLGTEDIELIQNTLNQNIKSEEQVNTIPVIGGAIDQFFIYAPINTITNYVYYTPGIKGISNYAYISNDSRYNLIAGEWPNEDSPFGEIVVTKNFFDTIYENSGIFNEITLSDNNITQKEVEITTPADLVDLHLRTNDYGFKIVGVLDTKLDKSTFEILKNYPNFTADEIRENAELSAKCLNLMQYQIHSLAFSNQATIDKIIQDKSTKIDNGTTTGFCFHDNFYVQGDTFSFDYVLDDANLNQEILDTLVTNPYSDKPQEDVHHEIYLNIQTYINSIQSGGYKSNSAFMNKSFEFDLPEEMQTDDFTDVFREGKGSINLFNINGGLLQYLGSYISVKYTNSRNNTNFISTFLSKLYLGEEEYASPDETITFTVTTNSTVEPKTYNLIDIQQDAAAMYDKLLNTISGYIFSPRATTSYIKYASDYLNEYDILGDIKVGKNNYMPGIPVLLKGFSRKIPKDTIYVDNELYLEFKDKAIPKQYGYLLLDNKNNNERVLKNIISNNFSFPEYRGKTYIAQNYAFSSFSMVDTFISNLSTIFLISGGVASLFAIILFSNFISSSINDKQAEIGILRALGSRGSDIFKLFFFESLLVSIICSALSIVLSSASIVTINLAFSDAVSSSITVFFVTPLLIGVIIGLSLFVAFVSSYVPVRKIAKKKPVDAIRNTA